MTAPRLRVTAAAAFERDVRFRLPFRFGAATVSGAPQAFLQVRVQAENGDAAVGHAAEMMVPKWFDKDPALGIDDTVNQLRRSLATACAVAPDLGGGMTAAGLAAAAEAEQRRRLADVPGLVAGYGPALLARAVLDALCRMHGVGFFDAARGNLFGLTADLLPPDLLSGDRDGFDIDGFLAGLTPLDSVAARHTVGLTDALSDAEASALPAADLPEDDLPVSLEGAIARYGHDHFKIKLCGDADADLDRLAGIAAVLDRLPRYAVTLDGNEQFADAESCVVLIDRLRADPRLARLSASVLYLEQPIARAAALERPIGALADRLPVIIDESDAERDSFRRAWALGYRGVAAKGCKGVYRSIVNAARCRRLGDGAFLSAEDLTTQAGLAVQQDLAIAALLGLGHVERNGHHYAGGMAGAPKAEVAAFLAAYPDLYAPHGDDLRLIIAQGRLRLGSLSGVGFASGAVPDTAALRPLASPS